jgi:hypothetical protein
MHPRQVPTRGNLCAFPVRIQRGPDAHSDIFGLVQRMKVGTGLVVVRPPPRTLPCRFLDQRERFEDELELVLLEVLLDVFELELLDEFELEFLDEFELVLLDEFELELLDWATFMPGTVSSAAGLSAVRPASTCAAASAAPMLSAVAVSVARVVIVTFLMNLSPSLRRLCRTDISRIDNAGARCLFRGAPAAGDQSLLLVGR